MNKIFIIVLVLVLVILGGYFLLKGEEAQAPMPVLNTETLETIVTPTEKAANVITYNDTGYSPSTLTVKLGTTIAFKNESTKNMWPASAIHPTHTAYSGTTMSEHCPDLSNSAFDACQGIPPGESWSFTFEKIGEWKYHDHLTPSYLGKITVE